MCSGIIFPINIIPSLGRGCLYVGESHGGGGCRGMVFPIIPSQMRGCLYVGLSCGGGGGRKGVRGRFSYYTHSGGEMLVCWCELGGGGGCRGAVFPIIPTLVGRCLYVGVSYGRGGGGVQGDGFPYYTHSNEGMFACWCELSGRGWEGRYRGTVSPIIPTLVKGCLYVGVSRGGGGYR